MSVLYPRPLLNWTRFKSLPAHGGKWSLEDAEETYYRLLKGCLDFIAAAVLLIVTAPIILIAAVLVKLTSPGPVLYSQVRLGKGGKPFRIYKLRTMRHNCELDSGPRWATRGDPRITPLGRFLRASHLDELPQLFNILRGDMSLVGPRPERPEFVLKLERHIPLYRERLRLRPGVTGLAQVHLPADTDLESVRRKMAYDYFYIRQLNIWLDMRLIAVTALQVLGIPFAVSRRLLFIPSAERIEPVYESLADVELGTVA
jgi:lipopolysaccharide/colanic/teichoic acid biosynthesis glycosyltransferase